MNKYEEALKDILDSKDFEYSGESVYLMQILVKRATPMKPYNQSRIDFGNCSHCKSELESGKPFCPHCGQALDFSTDK